MGISKQIKMAMLDKGIKPAQLAEVTEQGTQTLYNSLSRDNMRVDKAARLADALQCDIVLRDRETGKIYD